MQRGRRRSLHSRVAPFAAATGAASRWFLSESQVRDADAECLRQAAAVEETWHRVAGLPRLYRPYGRSHLVGQPSLRPLARIGRGGLPLRANFQNPALPGSRGGLAILHYTARYCLVRLTMQRTETTSMPGGFTVATDWKSQP